MNQAAAQTQTDQEEPLATAKQAALIERLERWFGRRSHEDGDLTITEASKRIRGLATEQQQVNPASRDSLRELRIASLEAAGADEDVPSPADLARQAVEERMTDFDVYTRAGEEYERAISRMEKGEIETNTAGKELKSRLRDYHEFEPETMSDLGIKPLGKQDVITQAEGCWQILQAKMQGVDHAWIVKRSRDKAARAKFQQPNHDTGNVR